MFRNDAPPAPISLLNEERSHLATENIARTESSNVRSLRSEVNESALTGQRNDDLPYAGDDEDFLQLVPKTYAAFDMLEWQPPPPIIGNPKEPGYNGKLIRSKMK